MTPASQLSRLLLSWDIICLVDEQSNSDSDNLLELVYKLPDSHPQSLDSTSLVFDQPP